MGLRPESDYRQVTPPNGVANRIGEKAIPDGGAGGGVSGLLAPKDTLMSGAEEWPTIRLENAFWSEQKCSLSSSLAWHAVISVHHTGLTLVSDIGKAVASHLGLVSMGKRISVNRQARVFPVRPPLLTGRRP